MMNHVLIRIVVAVSDVIIFVLKTEKAQLLSCIDTPLVSNSYLRILNELSSV